MHGLAGRKQTPEHIRLRVEATAQNRTQWPDEKRQQVNAAISAGNRVSEPEIRSKISKSKLGSVPWNKGNDWRNNLSAEEVRAIAAMRARKCRQNNPGLRVHQSMSTLIRLSLRENKAGKSWEKIVGYTMLDLKGHLESLFTIGMTWENYGAWQIDHIKPRAAFSFTNANDPQFVECWSLSNLQPLWAADNNRKKDRY